MSSARLREIDVARATAPRSRRGDRLDEHAQRDATIKRRLYRAGRRSGYWVVNPGIAVVRVHRRHDDGFDRPVELRLEKGDVLTTPLLPGLELPLERIFRV